MAYDHSRVKVQPTTHNLRTDYVNANYIAGYGSRTEYIASQGPVPDGFNACVFENSTLTASKLVWQVLANGVGEQRRCRGHGHQRSLLINSRRNHFVLIGVRSRAASSRRIATGPPPSASKSSMGPSA